MRSVLSALPLVCAAALAALAVALLAAPVASAAMPDDPPPPCPIDPETGGCLPDRDRDGRGDTVDNCPDHYNPGQEDNDRDSVGNVCDPTPNGDPPPPPPQDGGGGGGGGGGGTTSSSNCNGGEGVYVYQHVDYQGACWKLTADSTWAGSWGGVGNDQVSSVRLVGPFTTVLYTDANFGGGAMMLTSSSQNPWNWWGGPGNDNVSSARAYRDGDRDGHADSADNCPSYYSPDNRCDSDTAGSVEEDESSSSGVSTGASSDDAAVATSGCHWRRIGRKHHNVLTAPLVRYNLRVDWCWNASVITSVNVRVWPEIVTSCCWHFRRHVTYEVYDTANDVTYYSYWGRTYFRVFVQGEFELCFPAGDLGCMKVVYPWIELVAYRGGSSSKSSGGTR